MKHLLFWTYFVIASYFIFNVSNHETSDALLKRAAEECKTTPELDGQRMYCVGFTVKEACEKGLDLKICGRFDK